MRKGPVPSTVMARSPANPGIQKPVRLTLKRVNCNLAKAYPPDGHPRDWWARLQRSLGTGSSDFVNAAIFQLQAAARHPDSGISEIAVNAALTFIESVQPQNEMEAALAMQMACNHAATMTILGRLNSPGGGERHIAAFASAATRLMRAYAIQVGVFRRLRTTRPADLFTRLRHERSPFESERSNAANLRSR